MAKNIRLFQKFMKGHVNLNKTRINRLNRHVEAVGKFLVDSDLRVNSFYPQGSYAQGTIIKPAKDNKEFDADIVVRMELVDYWDPKDYLEELYKIFKNDSVYSFKVSRKTRCVTLDYKGDFHLDIVPLLRVDKWHHLSKMYRVVNRSLNKYEPTNVFGYTDWLKNKNLMIPNNFFFDSIKILKYLRDIKQNFSIKSVLLNTILVEVICERNLNQSYFSDLPTTFKTLFNWLNEWLQDKQEMPIIANPVLASGDFNRHWDDIKYQNFRSKIELYNNKINDAFSEKKPKLSKQKWQAVFGAKF